MTLIIAAILIVGFILIATEKLTNVNKAAVAIFVGTLGWILYVSFGTDYVTSQHAHEFSLFLKGATPTGTLVKQYIAHDIFLKYVGRAAEIVLFLLATMTIVEILQNNGCFDFIPQLMRTRSSKKLLWVVAATTFVISANLDNLTTTVMMLTIIRGVVRSRRQRMLLGGAVVISANVGGALTVIGEPTGLVMWNTGFVTATDYSLSMAVPCLLAWAIPVWWIGNSLQGRADLEWITMPYRGDDTNLNLWQRFVMLLVGIGGLWFIPTFHNITKLSPFLGALCVLSVLWVVNELFNRKLMRTDEMIQRRVPRVLQYGVIQMMLFVMGIMLALGVVKETGAFEQLMAFFSDTGFLGKDGFGIWGIGHLVGSGKHRARQLCNGNGLLLFSRRQYAELQSAQHLCAKRRLLESSVLLRDGGWQSVDHRIDVWPRPDEDGTHARGLVFQQHRRESLGRRTTRTRRIVGAPATHGLIHR